MVVTIGLGGYVVDPANPAATVTLVDDTVPTVTVSATSSEAVEGSTTQTGSIAIFSSSVVTQPMAVYYTITGVPATRIAPLPYPAIIPAGSDEVDLTISVPDDGVFDGPQVLTLTLAPSTSYDVLTQNSASVTIIDAEMPFVSIAATTPIAMEGGGSGAFTITRTGDLSAALTVGLQIAGTAIPGTAYAVLPPTVTIPAGATSVAVPVTALPVSGTEGMQTVIASIAPQASLYNQGAITTDQVLIFDNTIPALTVTASGGPSKAGATGTFTITRTGSTAADIQVTYSLTGTAAAGFDYQDPGLIVDIPAGLSSATIMINPIDTGFATGPKTVTLTLAPVTALDTGPSATLVIQDTDLPTISIITTQLEAIEATTPTVVGMYNISRSIASSVDTPVTLVLSGTAVNAESIT